MCEGGVCACEGGMCACVRGKCVREEYMCEGECM